MSMKVVSLGAVASAVEGITCSSSTNATPIVLTIAPSTKHRIKDGDRIGVAGITGNTAANGDFTASATAATAVTLLGSVGNGTHGGTAVLRQVMDTTPHMKRHSAACFINPLDTAAFVGTISVDGSDDNVTANFATALTSGALALGANVGHLVVEVKLSSYMRLICSAYTSGECRANLAA
jgi:hypothetical protein